MRTHSRDVYDARGTSPGSGSRGLASTPNVVLFAQRLQTGPVTLRQSGSVVDLVIEHAEVFTLREATRHVAKAEPPSPPHLTAMAPLYSPPEGPRWTSPVHKSGI